ncbi:hypothetical protein JZO66_14225 [Enterococcus sp. DIV0242_7C1]|uniref:Uncharacterized protein n=1 Tax=Candidatus Enterococcus dunnyi TaxID=1834192 RepID=A0A200JD16_9ENTE|nr:MULTISPECIES: hypothetical protein [unclassified Enterococcus]MBO0471711.1 hypothetical protein [Enterococcus sp. DIV0242_7C1]OUZ34570.1 hypothetical protein A5889_000045 [Enterococcus sp. 9D6_DIV0238]
MSDYQLKDKGLKGNSETTSAVSAIAYEIENGKYAGLKEDRIRDQIREFQKNNKFPQNLEYVDSFLNKDTSLSGVAFRDRNTGIVTVGIAGTNADNGTIDSMKDYLADASIAFNGSNPSSNYFASGNDFINKLQEKYPVGTITGHSKGGRDSVILGVGNDIPNIVTYNPAPVSHDYLQLLTTFNSPIWKLGERAFSAADMKQRFFDYKGNVIHIASSKDMLTGLSDLGKAYYFGQRVTIPNGKGHSITGFLTDKEQQFIRSSLGKYTTVNKIIGQQMAEASTRQKLKELSNLKKKFLKQGGGRLTSSQEIYLDASEALALTRGMKATLQVTLDGLKVAYKQAIADKDRHWIDTLSDAGTVGSVLSSGEQLESLNQGRATEERIRHQPKAELEASLAKLTAHEEKYDQLIEQTKQAIDEQIQADKSLAQLVGIN